MRIAKGQLPIAETRQDALERFGGCLHSGRGVRRSQRSVNGLLMGSWREVAWV